jgi:hypothetical protein
MESVIVKNPKTSGGTPVFRGTRVPLQLLFDSLERGHTLEEFLAGLSSAKTSSNPKKTISHSRMFEYDPQIQPGIVCWPRYSGSAGDAQDLSGPAGNRVPAFHVRAPRKNRKESPKPGDFSGVKILMLAM